MLLDFYTLKLVEYTVTPYERSWSENYRFLKSINKHKLTVIKFIDFKNLMELEEFHDFIRYYIFYYDFDNVYKQRNEWREDNRSTMCVAQCTYRGQEISIIFYQFCDTRGVACVVTRGGVDNLIINCSASDFFKHGPAYFERIVNYSTKF